MSRIRKNSLRAPHVVVLGVLACGWIAPKTALSQTVWSIAGNGNWNTASNWSPNVVPNSPTTDVVINNSTSTVTMNVSPVIRDLLLAFGNTLTFANQQDLSINGNVANQGLIYVNQTGTSGSTELIAAANVTLSGSGMVRLSRRANSGNSRVNSAAGFSLTQQAGHSIVGAGIIGADLINLGLVQADVSQATTGNAILLEGNDKTNQGVFQAAANSTLQIDAININNAGGTIRALADSFVSFTNGVTVTGGIVESIGTGVIQTSSANNTNFQNVTINGQVETASRGDIGLEGMINNTGSIVLTPGNATSDTLLEILGAGATVSGGGTITLVGTGGANEASMTGAGGTLTIANQTFEGSGDFGRGNVAIINQTNGIIRANTTGRTLHVDANSGGLITSGLLHATNGGTLLISDSFVNQGVIQADASSLIDVAASLTNGVGGSIRGHGELEFTGLLTNLGVIAPGTSIGTLTIDPTGPGGESINFGNSSVLEIELSSAASFDVLDINGNVSLGGTLEISLLSGFLPNAGDTFNILQFDNALFGSVGEFANVTNGGTLLTAGGEGTFTVDYISNSPSVGGFVRLSNFVPSAVPEPSTAGCLGLICLAIAGRFRQRRLR